MIYKFTAEKIYAGNGTTLTDKVIITDHSGLILDIQHSADHDPASVQHFLGIVIPGMINTHCHLELSHMKGKAESGTGLLPFLKKVVGFRDVPQEIIDEAINNADAEMCNNGIVAVGDISNKADTVKVKSQSKISYYTFVEMFDFLQPSMTPATIEQYKSVFEAHGDNEKLKKSYVPHAPYTVSPELFRFIHNSNKPGSTISIHNQETAAENELFLSGSGQFRGFYESFGFSLEHFAATGQTSIHYALKHLNAELKTLFVHNTQTRLEDIIAAHGWSKNVYWATCANANLYIENRLPDYAAFIESDARMTIGTDSLTSNWQLSVWEEIKTIKKYCSWISLSTLIQWACLNGARALSFDDRMGSIEKGKTPGLVWVDCKIENNEPDISQSNPVRII